MKNTVRNARFWFYWNGDFVKLTLQPEQVIELHHSEPTDEGYSAKYEYLRHEGDGVYNEWERSGRDCDGRHSEGGRLFCSLDKLATRMVGENDNVPSPDWEKIGRDRVYDQYAQLSGY